MKKLPTVLLSTLIFGLVGSNLTASPASALYRDDTGATWYTVAEALEFKEELDRETEEICGDNLSCREELYFSRMESGDQKFWVVEQLTQQQITVTSVNPGAETLKVLFFDEDVMMRQMGVHEPLTLGEFYMGWFEYGVDRIYNYSSYAEELFADTFLGAHLIYAQKDNEGDKIPANQEFELSAKGSNLNLNTSGEIAYGAYADPYFNAAGRFIYASCLSEPDYAEGVECKMMISAERGIAYFPPRETETTGYGNMDSNSQDSAILQDNEITNQSEVLITQAETNLENTTTEFTSENITTPQLVVTEPKSPNTGTYTNPCVQKTIEFPWWLVILIALGDATVLWLFWPKSRKNSKKTLDKNEEVR